MTSKRRRKPLTREECYERYGVYKLPSDRRERIRLIKPWEKSTGPRTELGKLISSKNNLKHGLKVGNLALRQASRIYWEQRLGEAIVELKPWLNVVGAKISPELKDMILELADGFEEAA